VSSTTTRASATPTTAAALLDNSDSISRYLAPVPATALSTPATFFAGVAADPFRAASAPVATYAREVPVASTQPATSAPDAPRRTWALTAILITDARRVAVINEQLVGVGDTLPGGGRVTAVERDHVVVTTADGTRRQLNLPDAGGV
jgi:hypothetical protein